MTQRARFLLQQIFYDLRTGLLLRPAAITALCVLLAAALLAVERSMPGVDRALAHGSWIFHPEVGSAQVVLGTIASTMMTVVTVVYSLLVMALSLASMQYSPRVLAGFLRDGPSQTTLGVFIGTFTYSLVVLRAVHGPPEPFVPVLAVSGAVVLALASLAWLIYFVHHIATGIQANHIIDRIAAETEAVIVEVHPEARAEGEAQPTGEPVPPPARDAAPVPAATSGYLQLVDEPRLVALAAARGARIDVVHAIGEFVVAGEALALVAPPERADAALRADLAAAFDLGPVRTLQQDVAFGIRQIVDVALKAISPAVNDPSTAATCIDHLARLLSRLARRRLPPTREHPVAAREAVVVLRRVTFRDALDLAFNQLRQYGRSDMAVALRLLRALRVIARATLHPPDLARIAHHASLIVAAAEGAFPEAEREELRLRQDALDEALRDAHAAAARATAHRPPAPDLMRAPLRRGPAPAKPARPPTPRAGDAAG